MSRYRSKSTDSHPSDISPRYTDISHHFNKDNEAINILLMMRLELLCNLKDFKSHNLTNFIYETQRRLLTNEGALRRLLSEPDIHELFESSNEILSTARYLKQHSHSLGKPDVLQYLINMYEH